MLIYWDSDLQTPGEGAEAKVDRASPMKRAENKKISDNADVSSGWVTPFS